MFFLLACLHACGGVHSSKLCGPRSLAFTTGADLVLELESGESLVVKDFARVSSVEVEVRVAEVDERDACDEQKQVRVVALAGRLEGIVADDLWPLPTYREMLFIK